MSAHLRPFKPLPGAMGYVGSVGTERGSDGGVADGQVKKKFFNLLANLFLGNIE